jgi:hypothetical protein
MLHFTRKTNAEELNLIVLLQSSCTYSDPRKEPRFLGLASLKADTTAVRPKTPESFVALL